jgi:hypothetical protein
VKELMANLVDPTADVVWESVGTIYTKEGVFEKAPQRRRMERRPRQRGHAGRGRQPADDAGALRRKRGMGQAGAGVIVQSQRAIKAAEAARQRRVFNTGADIYEACVNCHKRFDPRLPR